MKVKTDTLQTVHPKLKLFLDYLSQNPNLSKTVEHCAGYLAICPRQLRRLCRQQLNVSPSEVMKFILVDHAQQKLRHPYVSVKAIAYELGFSDSSNFSTFFKKVVGISPKYYRQQLVQQEMSEMQIEMSE
ncbi:MAG: AraC family transcriptional regulator [Bacteroidota bacterium]